MVLVGAALGAIGTVPAAAQTSPTGGASVGASSAPSAGAAPVTPAPTGPLAPVTARSSKLTYSGPVFQVLADGEIVPYTPPAAVSPATAQSTPSQPTASASQTMTGGSIAAPAPGVTTPAAPAPATRLLVPGTLARYVNGLAAAPSGAPPAVQEMIWAANTIIGLPYVWGGGHNPTFSGRGYDCSGTVSFALHGASLLSSPLDSSSFERWGAGGLGQWVTIFTNPGHAYVDVAGLRLDTSAADDPSNQQGPRWRPLRRNNRGYRIRHPLGL
jgi:cell wall-associated NlpC family hydrolase